MRKIVLCLAVGLLASAFVGCGGSPSNNNPTAVPAAVEGSLEEAVPVLIPDPERAVEVIYQTIENRRVDRVSDNQLNEVFGLSSFMVTNAVAYVSDVTGGGLCDIAIIRPAPGMTEHVREALNQYMISRADSFRNQDILNAYYIASNAVVFSRGDYVVMLMLPDNDSAREIINLYLPAS